MRFKLVVNSWINNYRCLFFLFNCIFIAKKTKKLGIYTILRKQQTFKIVKTFILISNAYHCVKLCELVYAKLQYNSVHNIIHITNFITNVALK